jgi:hypothetical protein
MVSLQKSAFDMNKGYSLFTERFHKDRVIVSDLLRIGSFARTPGNTLIYRHLVVPGYCDIKMLLKLGYSVGWYQFLSRRFLLKGCQIDQSENRDEYSS